MSFAPPPNSSRAETIFRLAGRVLQISAGARFVAHLFDTDAVARHDGRPDGGGGCFAASDGLRANCQHSAAVWTLYGDCDDGRGGAGCSIRRSS